jgi:hypothetical protein
LRGFPIQALFARVPIYEPYGKISGNAYKIIYLEFLLKPIYPLANLFECQAINKGYG